MMTEIQSLIAQLNDKVKKQTDELTKKKQEVACLMSLIENDKVQLKRIVSGMEVIPQADIISEDSDELAG